MHKKQLEKQDSKTSPGGWCRPCHIQLCVDQQGFTVAFIPAATIWTSNASHWHVQSSRKMWQQAFWQKSFVHVVGRSEEDNVGPSLPWSGTVQKMFQRPSVVERRSRHHLIELRHLYRRLRMNNNTLAIICDHMSLLCTIVLQENSHQFPHPSLFMPWRLSTGRHVGDLRGSVWNSSRADKTLN